MNQTELPHDIDAEKELLAALLVRQGEVIPAVNAVVEADDFYRPEHRVLYRIIVQLYAQGIVPNVISIFEEMRKTGEFDKVDRKYVVSIAAMSVTNAYAKAHARIVKEKSDLRRLLQISEKLAESAQQGKLSSADIVAEHRNNLDGIGLSTTPSKKSSFGEYFADLFDGDVEDMKSYAERKTGFDNIDEQQFFTPGLYVIGATPAAGKTTFCWQLLEQLAQKGESCIFCSYEMSRLELFSKSLSREMFRRFKHAPTSAQIRRGATDGGLREVILDFAVSGLKLSVLELQDETINNLLGLLVNSGKEKDTSSDKITSKEGHSLCQNHFTTKQ